MVSMQKLPREFYNRETTLVAEALLGHHLIHRSEGIERIGNIVEVEAYLGQHDLLSEDFFISNAGYEPPKHITETARIGVHYAKEWERKPLRFYIQDNAFISKG